MLQNQDFFLHLCSDNLYNRKDCGGMLEYQLRNKIVNKLFSYIHSKHITYVIVCKGESLDNSILTYFTKHQHQFYLLDNLY